uniref:Uncharacterized protein n=1 Tax=Glossina palpalis gambiensis TaxID=67801 RepID=A0A1B0AYH7_9MUSC
MEFAVVSSTVPAAASVESKDKTVVSFSEVIFILFCKDISESTGKFASISSCAFKGFDVVFKVTTAALVEYELVFLNGVSVVVLRETHISAPSFTQRELIGHAYEPPVASISPVAVRRQFLYISGPTHTALFPLQLISNSKLWAAATGVMVSANS